MTIIAPQEPEDVELEARRAMTPARKRRIWTAWHGRCWFCRQPVPMEGPEVIYDHMTPLWLKGSDADEEIGPLHAEPCNRLKTAADLKRIAKTKRQKAKHDGTFPPSPTPMRKGRSFRKRWPE